MAQLSHHSPWTLTWLFFLFPRHDEDGIRPMQQQDLHRAIEKMRKSKDVSMQNLAMEIVFD